MGEKFIIQVVIDPRKSVSGARKVRKGLDEVETSAGALNKTLKRVFAFTAVAAGIRAVGRYADSFTNLQNRLRTVTDSQEQLTDATEELFAISQRTRSSFEGTAEVYARVGLAARNLGREQEELLEFTESLNQAVILSGASAQEASAGLLQLSQGLASGTLRGDELRSVLEQLPVVADVIADSLGVTRGELREMGAEGKISAEIVLDAFKEAREELDERFGKSVPTLSQAFGQLSDSILIFIGTTDAAFGASAALATGIIFISENIEFLIAGMAILAAAALPAVITGMGALIASSATLTAVFAGGIFSPVIIAAGLAAAATLAFTSELEKAHAAALRASDSGAKFAQTDFGKIGDDVLVAQRALERINATIAKTGNASPAAARQIEILTGKIDDFRAVQKILADGTGKTTVQAQQQLKAMKELAAAVDKSVASIELENKLLNLNSRERQIHAALLQEVADLEKKSGSEATDEQKAAIEVALRRNQALTEQAAALEAVRGPQEAFNARVAALKTLEEQGRIGLEEMEQALLDMAGAAEGVDLSAIGEIGGEDAVKRLQDQLAATKALAEEESRRGRLLSEIQGPLAGLQQQEEDIKALREAGTITLDQANEALERNAEAIRMLNPEYAAQAEALRAIEEPNLKLQEDLATLEALLQAKLITLPQYRQELQNLGVVTETAGTAADGFAQGLKNAGQRMTDVEGAAQTLAENGFQAAEDALVSFVTTGEADFAAFAESLLADLARLIIKQLLFNAISGSSFAGTFGLEGRAEGGPVNPNEQFIVGEEGPELFTPETAGNITPAGETAAIMNGSKQQAPIVNVAPPSINITNVVEEESDADFEDAVMNTIQRKRRSVQGIIG